MRCSLLLVPWLLGACPAVEPGDPFVPDTDVDWTPGTPVARCAAAPDAVEPPLGEAHVSGAGSHDPAGDVPLTYSWTIASAPPGADLHLGVDDDEALAFTPNVAGTWLAELTVRNSTGAVSAPCSAAVEVVPAQSLWVELSWDNTNDDLDLHVLRSGAVFGSDDDCYPGNCTPIGVAPQLNWGGAGSDDDPLLLEDSVDQGPEIVSIGDPAGGTYAIAVHDALNDDPGDTQARIRVFIDGLEGYRLERTLRAEPSTDDALLWFAEVSYPNRSVTTCPPGGC